MRRFLQLEVLVLAASAWAQSIDELQKRERCAVRVSIALSGKTPDANLLASEDRQALADALLDTTLGLHLIPSTNAPDVDITAGGRQAVGCRGCHYDGMFALDLAASVLGRRVGTGDTMTFDAPSGQPVTLLGGLSVSNDKELVT